MIKTGIPGIICIIIAFIFLSSVIRCSTATKNVRSVSCAEGSTLFLTVEKEFVELSYQNVYNLAFENRGDKIPRVVTGNISILPEAKRYRNMITVKDFTPGKAKSLFQYHYLFPSQFTKEEFELICSCYEKNRNSLPELQDKIGALVYGDYKNFREVFRLPEGFFIVTEYNGNLTITDDPSREGATIPAEKRHFNNIGYFDENGRLHLRRGKIISSEFNGFYGKPVKQIEFMTENSEVTYTGEVEIVWCDILYREDKTGINIDYILSAVNENGERLDKVFNYSQPYGQK